MTINSRKEVQNKIGASIQLSESNLKQLIHANIRPKTPQTTHTTEFYSHVRSVEQIYVEKKYYTIGQTFRRNAAKTSPSPLSYQPNFNSTVPDAHAHVFPPIRQHVRYIEPEKPNVGPGQYEQPVSRTRSVSIGHSYNQLLGRLETKLAQAVPSPVEYSVNVDKNKSVKINLYGRKTEFERKNGIPGPNAYTLKDREEEQFPKKVLKLKVLGK
ncbi:SHIPPO_1-like protein [Hexamita inflata]|uniref:SHIPPO 1-like protein n=1 Tax=Hexamita inflata TaxID=28002 RepID=A0AA86QAG9_9EUKA|nr:SHIPPO 1-like protein [Hexamita inflata]